MVNFATLVLRTPIDLCNHDRIGADDGHLVAKLLDGLVCVVAVIAATIPSSVVVYGIADIFTRDGVRGIFLVVALIACARHPDDALEAVLTNLVHNRLEEVV